MIFPKIHYKSILELSKKEVINYAKILKILKTKYDNLFQTAFPYSSAINQAPTIKNNQWLIHISFFPTLLRSKDLKKFMVGYQMFAEIQRDMNPEFAVKKLRNCSETHFCKTK